MLDIEDHLFFCVAPPIYCVYARVNVSVRSLVVSSPIN